MKLIQTVKRRMGNENEAGKRAGNASAPKDSSRSKPPGMKSGMRARVDADDPAFQILPKLRDTPIAERAELFRKKLSICSIVYDFSNDQHEVEKSTKRDALVEMIE